MEKVSVSRRAHFHILLVEDEEDLREMAALILEKCGYPVMQAANGVEALRIIEQKKYVPHLVVTDVAMPQMNGSDLAKKLRPLFPDIPIIFLSGHTPSEELSIEVEGELFLPKPYSSDQLIAVVENALSNRLALVNS